MSEGNEHRDRVAVITGGSGGIGGAIAARLQDKGSIVHVLDTKRADSSALSYHQVDVTNESQVEDTFNAIGNSAGRIDYLVCCAGIYQPRSFLEISVEDWQQTLTVNLTGYFLCCRAALRYMRQEKFGRIVLFSSMAARTGGKNIAHYAAAKGGVLGLMRSLAVEGAADNIRVNAISPVITDTAMPRAVVSEQYLESRKQQIPLGRIGDVSDMADACLFLLSEESSYLLGQDLRVNGGSALW